MFRLAEHCRVEGIAKLHDASTVLVTLSSGLHGVISSRKKATGSQNEYEDRELRIQVMGPACTPLYHVQDLGQFKKAFILLVKA